MLIGIFPVSCACRICINKVNVYRYADEAVVFAPTSPGIRELLVNVKILIYFFFQLVNNVVRLKVGIFRPKWSISENEKAFECNSERIENN